jgi:hypothetical protein
VERFECFEVQLFADRFHRANWESFIFRVRANENPRE